MTTSPRRAATQLIDLLVARAESRGSALVYRYLETGEVEGPTQLWTFAELDRRARAIGARLQAAGARGERALLLYPAGLDFIAGFFGCLYAGAVAVPTYPPDPVRAERTLPRLRAITRDSGARFVLTTASILKASAALGPQAPELAGLQWVATDEVPAELAAQWRRPDVNGGTLAFLQYTSGSTGQPKGVMLSHTNALHNCEGIRSRFELDERSSLLGWIPTFHDMGLISKVLQAVYSGIPCTLMSPLAFMQRPLRWLEAITHFRATMSAAPNFAYDLCARRVSPAQLAALDLRSWNLAITGSEPVRSETVERFIAVFAPAGLRREAYKSGYGLAESTLMVTGVELSAPPILRAYDIASLEQRRAQVAPPGAAARVLVSSGRPIVDTRVEIVAPETGLRCSAGQIGEIWVAGPSVGAGYWNRPEETERTFGARLADTGEGPFLRTGDLGFVDDGEVFVTGRIKDLLIFSGRNHYPQDIEATIEQAHPSVRPGCSAAFALEVDDEERLGVAFEVELRGDADPEAIMGAIRQAIAAEHGVVPHAVTLLRPRSISKTSSGKIQRGPTRLALESGELEALARWTAPRPVVVGPTPTSADLERQIWAYVTEALGLLAPAVASSRDTPFAALGVDSARAAEISGRIAEALGRPVPPTLLFDHPTLGELVAHLTSSGQPRATTTVAANEAIAIVGMGCRFPGGVTDPESFWALLERGVDAIREVPKERWDVDAYYARDPDAPGKMTTRWGGFLDDIDRFEPEFFGISPREAPSIDPQQRLLLETSWEALERAGKTPEQLLGSDTGVYVGVCGNEYQTMALSRVEAIDAYSLLGAAHSTNVGRLSYWLGLKGPNVPIDTACSSSLVAVHLACQALRSGECSMALAGGVNLTLAPEGTVYFSKLGTISTTGRCRTFSDDADGYVRSEGCGIVVLKRLSDAQRDGDPILAVIRGSAVNQNGRSNGLAAPNGLSQEAVIRQALEHAGVTPERVGYVETHGTATLLGDPIEVRAIGAVLGEGRAADAPVVLGSVKTNIGHTEGAAGVAGLIKAVLCLQRGVIPKNLHFSAPNRHVAWSDSPTRVASEAQPFVATNGGTRIAGVSAFGFSGTNAHVVLEEAPVAHSAPSAPGRPAELVLLSARSEAALDASAARLREHLRSHPDVALGDLAHGLATLRGAMDHRLAIVVTSRGALIDALDAAAQGRTPAGAVRGTTLLARGKLAFLFSDLGAQTSGMGRGLHAVWPAFREAFDRCLGMFDGSEQSAISDRTATTQSALFVLEYALHALWRSWGVAPDVLAGRGLGEITAACVAGVFSLADAVRLVAARERWLMEPTQDPFRRVAESIRYQRPSTPLLCSLSGEVGGDEMCSADYWLRQVRETGCPDGVKSLHEAGVTTFVEVGPTASLGDGRDESVQVLEALGGVWSRGRSIDGSGVFPGGGRRPSLPTYPWQRRRYWLEHPGLPAPGLDGEQPAAGWLRDELARLTASERRRRMLAEVRTQVGAVLGLRGAEDLGHDRPFQELGMDSLMGLQLRNRLARAIGEQLPRDIIYSAASVERLGTALLALLGHGDDARPAASAAAPAVQSAQKSDKSRLRAALAGAPDVQTRIALLTPPLEQQLLRALGRGSLDPDLPLSETGIDDVLAAELCLRMGREQGLRVFPRELLRCGTFREFVRFVADCSGPYHAPERRLGLDELDRQIRSPYDVEALVGKETPSDQPALFVLSPPRSGSTLLRVMLAGHSRLFSPQELYLGGFSDMAAFDRHLGGTVLNMGVVATIAEVLSRNGSWNLYRQWAQSAVPTAQVYSFFGSRIGDRTLVDKSPLFFPPQAVIRRLARLFPRARFVHLVRHPVACIGSYVRERFHGIFEETQSIDPYDCAEWVWTRVQEGILELEAELGPGRMQRLYFEDLTTDPEQAFRRLCPSLGLAYEPALLTPYSGHRMVAGGFQLGDPNFVHHNKIHAEKADAWREEKLPHALRPRTLALAERLGYDTSALSSERPLRADEALHVETAMGGIDLEGDARLPLSVVPQVEAPAWHGAPRSIFLTGATGFLGAFVLDALLRHTDATVHCLARAEDVARAGQRLRENLAHYGLWRDEVQARIQPVPGDLSAPLLGMSATRYASLNREVDVVLHGAAQISYLQPYRNLFASNVEGTRRLLEFACAGRVVPVHYVSSFGSTLIRPFENTRMVDEVTAASGLGTESILELPLGYLETKWVTHRMVDEARRRGLPVTVYGPGLISGHSQSGVDSLSDSQFLHALIKGSAQLGCFPDGLGWRFIPVDVVARKVVQCTLHPASTNCDIYLDSTNLLPPELMVSALRSFGFDTRVVPYAAWRQKVLALADTNDVQNALFGFTDIIYALTPLRFLGQRYQMQWYLENRGCPEEIRSLIGPREYIQASLVRSMIDYYVRVGAMPRATMEPESP